LSISASKAWVILLGDVHAAELRVAPLEFDDGADEFQRRAFGLWSGTT
jgi:hypothetical protein